MKFVASLLLAATATAHFVIDSPASRFFDEEGQPKAPCGGQLLGARTDFPIVGGSIKGMLLHPTGTGRFSIVISKTDPVAAQFGQVLIGPGANVRLTEGNFDTGAIDLSSIPGVVDGAQATMQVQISTVDGVLYTCMDVTLRSGGSPPPQTTAAPVQPTSGGSGNGNGNGSGGNNGNTGGNNGGAATTDNGSGAGAATTAGTSGATTTSASKTAVVSTTAPVTTKSNGWVASVSTGFLAVTALFL
ncbi:hypothetical protein BDR26DRAFT_858438 [Obelidium mucronatum]|nr:hypothetical protein BDR26DRAFT_858438 [Obelidium mucronatum]